jgi:hypothetical protein
MAPVGASQQVDCRSENIPIPTVAFQVPSGFQREIRALALSEYYLALEYQST